MTYRELLELYRDGRLDKETAEKVAVDVEKHEAISEYLCDKMEISDIALGEDCFESTSQDFAKMVKHSIRMAFFKLGIAVFAVTLIAVLFIQFGLPRIVEQRYYNPAESIGDTLSGENNLMSRDFAVYTELMAPGYYRQDVKVESRGYGNYEIFIKQNYSWNDSFTDIAGKIEKGKLTYYGEDIFGKSWLNGIEWHGISVMEEKDIGAQTLLSNIKGQKTAIKDKSMARQRLNELNSGEMYLCYITLNKQSDYESLHQFIFDRGHGSEFWSAVRISEDNGANLWMKGDASMSTALEWDEEKYPYLFTWKDSSGETGDTLDKQHENINTNKNMKTHFLSMVRYMQDQKKFCQMMDLSEGGLSEAEKYVKKNGLLITGFVAVMDKETAIDFLNQDEVYIVKATPMQ